MYIDFILIGLAKENRCYSVNFCWVTRSPPLMHKARIDGIQDGVTRGAPIPAAVTPRVGVCAHTPGARPPGSGHSPGEGVGEPLLSWTLGSPGGHRPVRGRHPLQESADKLRVNGVLRDKRTVGSGRCREGSWLAEPVGDFEAET